MRGEGALREDRHGRAILQRDDFTMAERFTMLPRVIPFVLLLTGVMIALYGGYATPSETAGLGGLLALVLIARSTACGGRPTLRRS
jgi:TRAP-type C4-dicarboxylate transport system permease large subunit